MQKSDVHILVVDDDATFGAACKEAFSRAGFKATHFSRPDEAVSHCRLQTFHGAVIDCMLPKTNGRALAIEIKGIFGANFPVVMVSGIFKDKNFIRDSIQATGALEFFVKPAEVQKLVEVFEHSLESVIDEPLNPLQALFLKEHLPASERIQAINQAQQIHCFDLPWVIQLLLHPKISGHLDIIAEDGQVSGIGISGGKIVQLSSQDKKSYFGVLLIENGFVSQQEMDEVMNNSNKTKRVGERLVEANVLSPHAVNIVLAEQQGIRLSSIITNQTIQVKFVESDELKEDSAIERNVIFDLTDDWVRNKIQIEWLKNSYLIWEQHGALKGSEYAANHYALRLPSMQKIPDFLRVILSSKNLATAISQLAVKYDEKEIYHALHSALIHRLIRLGEAIVETNFDTHKSRLQKLKTDLSRQNLFERLGVTQKTREGDVKKAFHELAKIMHPDKLPSSSPDEIKVLAKETFNLINEAYSVLSNPEKRKEYIAELQAGQAESALRAEQMLEEAKGNLGRGEAAKALEQTEEAMKLTPPNSYTKLLNAWAQLRAAKNVSGTKVNQIKELMSSIPPEDRHNATYFFVKGLMLAASGDYEGARKCYENSASLDPNFVDAKRELNVLTLNQQRNKKTNDIFSADLRDLVGGLFKKR